MTECTFSPSFRKIEQVVTEIQAIMSAQISAAPKTR